MASHQALPPRTASSMFLIGLITLSVIGCIWLFAGSLLLFFCGISAIASVFFFQKNVRVFSTKWVTITGFWYLAYLAMIVIPSYFVYSDNPGERAEVFLAAVHVTLLTVSLGIYGANKAMSFKTAEIQLYYDRPIELPRDMRGSFQNTLIWLLLALGLFAIHLAELKTVPFIYLIRNPGDFETVTYLREDSFKLLNSPLIYFYGLLRSAGFPIIMMVTLGNWLLCKSGGWFAMLVIAFVSSVAYASLSAAKMPLTSLILLAFVFSFIIKRSRHRWRTLLAGILAGTGIPFLFYMLLFYEGEKGGGESSLEALEQVGVRLFYSPAEVVYWNFELFPGDVGYLHGRSIGKFAWLMGWDYFNTPNYVGTRVFGGLETINANSAFIGDLNADFGIPGVILGGILVGFIMQLIQIHCLRQPKTILNVAIFCYLIFAFWLLHSTSILVVLGSNGVLVVLLFQLLRRKMEPMSRKDAVRLASKRS